MLSAMYPAGSIALAKLLEARGGIEPPNKGFAARTAPAAPALAKPPHHAPRGQAAGDRAFILIRTKQAAEGTFRYVTRPNAQRFQRC